MLQLDTLHDSTVNGSCSGHFLSRKCNAGEVRKSSSRADDLCSPPVAGRELVAKRLPNGAAELSERPRVDAFCEVALSESQRSERERDEALYQAVRAHRHLERSASDVHHDCASDAEIEVRERAAEAEPRL